MAAGNDHDGRRQLARTNGVLKTHLDTGGVRDIGLNGALLTHSPAGRTGGGWNVPCEADLVRVAAMVGDATAAGAGKVARARRGRRVARAREDDDGGEDIHEGLFCSQLLSL